MSGTVKKEFLKDRIRVNPRWDVEEPYVLTTDSSCEPIAAIVSQKQNGEEKFISAAG